jgi:hypothetical protein
MSVIMIGLENNVEGRSIAWALDYPGCFAYGVEGSQAILNLPRALINYRDWVIRNGGADPAGDENDMDFRLAETWETYRMNADYRVAPDGQYEINAWFRHDWLPLTAEEIERGLCLLAWSRADLLALVDGLAAEALEVKKPGERWSIGGILGHVGGAEWWYLDRLDLAGLSRGEVPREPFARLAATRARLEGVLPTLAGRADLVRGKDGEFWSPRKLLRRALWHERDHWMHISRLLLEA